MKKSFSIFILLAVAIGTTSIYAGKNADPLDKEKGKVKSLSQDVKNMDKLNKLRTELTAEFGRLQPQVIRPAEGYLKYPYLIPAGFYKQMWDWDGFFMGNHLASIGKKRSYA